MPAVSMEAQRPVWLERVGATGEGGVRSVREQSDPVEDL